VSARRAAVIGAGPAGFYTTDLLLSAGWEVDLYDALPTPYGLVRSGVAPDHPKLKSVTRVFDKTSAKPGFRFFGGVELGEHVTRAELLERYHAVVYAVGTGDDNRLGIPGEDRPGSYSATEFVAWYNGHPDYSGHQFDLSGGRAVVVGNGNVAIDVARMLVLDPEELAPTDTADHAIDGFGRSSVDEVVLLGRRGPAQAAFTNPEVRELGELRRADVVCDPRQVEEATEPETPTAKRNVELFRDYAARQPSGKSHKIELRFLRSPLEILGEGEDGPVTGVRVSVNRLENGRAVPTGEEEIIPCTLVLRSIGYRGRPLEGIPFDERRGLIRNEGGRVLGEAGESCRGEYVVGWIKRGPSGVIGTNKKDAADTVARILEDEEAGVLGTPSQPDADAAAAWLATRAPDAVTWEGWQAIDEVEKRAGEAQGRPRVKLVTLAELLEAGRLTPAR
jgi:ferredoxin--NADP+ reductase